MEKMSASRQAGKNELPQDLPQELLEICTSQNGGMSQDGYFHFFGMAGPVEHNIVDWNKPDLWKKEFGLNESAFIFAEDAFGGQYFLQRNETPMPVSILSISDGKSYFMAENFQLFVKDVIEDPNSEIGIELKQLAQDFLKDMSQREPFSHIAYKTPIIFGGSETDFKNFELLGSVANLRISGQLFAQVKNLPKGTRIKKIEVDKENMRLRLVY